MGIGFIVIFQFSSIAADLYLSSVSWSSTNAVLIAAQNEHNLEFRKQR